MTLSDDVERLARLVRERVCRWVKNDPDIEEDLLGACAIASYALWRVLRAKGYNATFVSHAEGCHAHCWVEISGHVVDITATQFDGPEIAIFLIGQIPEWGYAYEFSTRSTNQQAVKAVSGWDDQSPLRYRSKIEKLVQGVQGRQYAE